MLAEQILQELGSRMAPVFAAMFYTLVFVLIVGYITTVLLANSLLRKRVKKKSLRYLLAAIFDFPGAIIFFLIFYCIGIYLL